jgi:hypothetical protein
VDVIKCETCDGWLIFFLLRAECMSVKRALRSFNIDMCTMSWTLRQQAPSNMHTTGNNNGRQRMLRVTKQVCL